MRFKAAWKANKRSVVASLAFASVLVLSVAAFWTLANATMPARIPPPAKSISVMLRIEGNGWNISYETGESYNNTVFTLLLEGARTLHIPVVWTNWTMPSDSILVQSIDGDSNGEGGRWWQYWVNGVYGSVGADYAALSDGDEVTWRFVQFPP